MEKSDVMKLSGLILLALLLCLPMILFDNHPKKDASMYYLPMIRQFAAGNWDHAYYPMVPPLLPTVGGLLASWIPISVYAAAMGDAQGLNDTINILLSFENGSTGTISYFTNGAKSLSKEYVEVYSSGITGIR